MTKHHKNNKKQMGGGFFDGIASTFKNAYGKLTGAPAAPVTAVSNVPNPMAKPDAVQAPTLTAPSADAKGPEERAAKETAEKTAKCDETTKKEKEDADKKNVTCKAATPFMFRFLGYGGKRTRHSKRTSKRTSKRSRAKNGKTAKNGKK
jgi:hypothetical protein